jgi:O-antigen/teichoic acid export membrane protein
MKSTFTLQTLGRALGVKKNVSLAIGSTVVRQIFSSLLYFISIWIVTRQLGPFENGILATVLLLPQTLYSLFNFGLGASYIYFLSNSEGNYKQMQMINWTLAAFLWALVALIIALSDDSLISQYLPGSKRELVSFSTFLFPFMLLGSWTSSLLLGTRRYEEYNKTLLIQPITFLILTAIFYFQRNLSVFTVLFCYLTSNFSLWILSEIKILKSKKSTYPPQRLSKIATFGLRAHLSNVITFLNYRIDLYLVTYFLNPTDTGIYALSITLAERFWLISSAASMIVFPESSANRTEVEKLDRMVKRIAFVVFQLTTVGALIAGALAQFVIPWLFGSSYVDSVIPFVILLPGIVVWSYMSVISNSLAGLGHVNVNLISALISLSINVVGNVFAVPRFGIIGAAFISSTAYVIAALFTIAMYAKIVNERSRLIHAI